MDKNRTILVGIVSALIGVVFVGIFVLIALDRDVEQVTTFALIVIPIIVAAAGLGANQLQQTEKLNTIGKNVNGNTTRLLAAVEQLISERPAATDRRPDDEILPEPISADTIARIKDDAGKLPSHAASGPAHRA